MDLAVRRSDGRERVMLVSSKMMQILNGGPWNAEQLKERFVEGEHVSEEGVHYRVTRDAIPADAVIASGEPVPSALLLRYSILSDTFTANDSFLLVPYCERTPSPV